MRCCTRLVDQARVLVDDHGAEVELAALQLRELLVRRRRRDLQVELRERRDHVPHQLLGATAHRTDADPRAAEILDPCHFVRCGSEEEQCFGSDHASDEFELIVLRPVDAVLDEREVNVASGLRGAESGQVLHGTSRRQVPDLALLPLRCRRQFVDDRVVVAALVARENAHAHVAQVGRGLDQRDEQAEKDKPAQQQREFHAR